MVVVFRASRRALPALLFSIIIAGCRSQPERQQAAAPAEPAPPPAARAAAGSAVDDLEGLWERDDGKRYLLVAVDGRLLGRRVDDEQDDLGCRLALEPADGRLRGTATFTRREDEQGALRLRWELDPADDGALEGRVQGADVDEGRELRRVWEERALRRVRALGADEARAERRVAAADRRIDEALAQDDPAALLEVFASSEVQALEDEPGARDVIARRLVALAGRLEPSTLEASGPRRGDRGQDEPGEEVADGPTLELRSLMPHLPFELFAPEGCELVGSEGSASLTGGAFALNIVENPEQAGVRGRQLTPSFFQDEVREVLEESDTHVVYVRDVAGEEGLGFEWRFEANGRTYHAFPDRFTAFDREQVDAMLSALRTLRPDPSAPASGPAEEVAERSAPPAGGPPDMDGFLALFDGTCKGVEAALEAYGVPGLERAQMDWFDLREPQVVKHEQDGARERFTLLCKAGMTERTYVLVWEGGRIVQVIEV